MSACKDPERERLRRERISEALTGRTLSEEHLLTLRGRTLSEQHRRRISEALRGRTLSEEHRRHLSETQRGKARGPYKEGHREAIGRGVAEAHRRKKRAVEFVSVVPISEEGRVIPYEGSVPIPLAFAPPEVDRVGPGPSLMAHAPGANVLIELDPPVSEETIAGLRGRYGSDE